jgi:hypothetical protein
MRFQKLHHILYVKLHYLCKNFVQWFQNKLHKTSLRWTWRRFLCKFPSAKSTKTDILAFKALHHTSAKFYYIILITQTHVLLLKYISPHSLLANSLSFIPPETKYIKLYTVDTHKTEFWPHHKNPFFQHTKWITVYLGKRSQCKTESVVRTGKAHISQQWRHCGACLIFRVHTTSLHKIPC